MIICYVIASIFGIGVFGWLYLLGKGEHDAVGLGILLSICSVGAYGWFSQNTPLPGTDATTVDAVDMIQECQKTLPRNQKCVIDLMVHPDDKH